MFRLTQPLWDQSKLSGLSALVWKCDRDESLEFAEQLPLRMVSLLCFSPSPLRLHLDRSNFWSEVRAAMSSSGPLSNNNAGLQMIFRKKRSYDRAALDQP